MNRFPQDRGPLYTLEQVGERTGIHPMLLQSYLRSEAWRVPTVWVAGEERYPREALAAFREMHEEAQRASAPRHADPAGDAPNWGRRRLLSLTAQRRSGEAEARNEAAARSGAAGNGMAGNGAAGNGTARNGTAPGGATPDSAASDGGEAGRSAGDGIAAQSGRVEPATNGHATVEAVSRRAEQPLPEPRRPSRPLFTLQQVHEHTGIPYPILALYGASEAQRIPAAGERYAPLYPWEAMTVFCRIHQEKNPAWQAPALPAAPPPEEDAASRELSARLERLERTQTDLAEQIRRLIAEDEPYLSATSSALHA